MLISNCQFSLFFIVCHDIVTYCYSVCYDIFKVTFTIVTNQQRTNIFNEIDFERRSCV